MTRTALPSLRTMDLGATRVTFAARPSMGAQAGHQLLLPAVDLAQVVGEHFGGHLHLNVQGVGGLHPVTMI